MKVASQGLTVPPVDLTAKDFDAVRESIKNFIKTQFPDLITEFGDQSLLMVLVDLIAYEVDNLNFYIDLQANESYLPTARQRKNIVKLAKLVGYVPRTALPASVDVETEFADAILNSITVRTGTKIQVGNVFFEVTPDDVVIPVDSEEFTFSLVEGQTFEEIFTSNGAAFQKFKLLNTPVIQNTFRVIVDSVTWTQVSSLAFSRSEANSTKTYEAQITGDDEAVILFGDNSSSDIPALDAEIRVTYRIGGGVAGNVTSGAINTNIQAFENNETPTQVRINNIGHPASGGVDRETIDSIKLNAPIAVRTNENLVTKLDYEGIPVIFTGTTGQIARTRIEVLKSDGKQNLVHVFAWTRGADGAAVAPSQALLTELSNFIEKRKMVTVQHQVGAGSIMSVNVQISYKLAPGFLETEVTQEIEDRVVEFFNSDEFFTAEALRVIDLWNLVHDTPGVMYGKVILPTDDVVPMDDEVPVIGSLTIATVV